MGPTTLFDKSFLQALNRDEAAIFDVLFRSNITPVFFAETLADLDGGQRGGRSPAEIVGNLAAKSPVWGSVPVSPHLDLALADLLGQRVAMDHVPVCGGGRCVEVNGKKGIVFDYAPEMAAFNRWQAGDFEGVEREFASAWRAGIRAAPRNVDAIIDLGGNRLRLRDLTAVKALVDEVLSQDGRTWAVLQATMINFNIPPWAQRQIAQRWKTVGRPKLRAFAPYAAYVFSIDLFFHLAAATGKIAAQRPSNRIDMAYFYYLPFSQIFVSGDNLHERVAPHFLENGQHFVRADSLKHGLAELDAHYSAHPDIHTEGLMRVASWPPLEGDFYVSTLYDQVRPNWRVAASKPRTVMGPEAHAKILAELKAHRQTETAIPAKRSFGVDLADSIILERRVALRRGKWQFMPAGMIGDVE